MTLIFPFFWLDLQGMQLALLPHAAAGLVMIAVIFGHIYIGTVGMEGAFDAMWSGGVAAGDQRRRIMTSPRTS